MVELNDSYPNPPIVEVAWEIRFPAQLKINRNIDEFQELVRDSHPFVEKFNDWVSNIDIGKDVAGSESLQQSIVGAGWNFKTNEKGSDSIRIKDDSVSVITRNHKNFKDFRTKISYATDIFRAFLSDLKYPINRIGLRYINVCNLPNDDLALFAEYFNSPFSQEFSNFEQTRGFHLRHFEIINEINLTTTYRSTKIGDVDGLLIDMDAFSTSKTYLSTVLEKTDHLHRIVRNRFGQLIKQKFVNEVMKKEEQ